MGLNSATIEFLLSKGLSGEDLLVVAQRMESEGCSTLEKRRAYDRQRKRERRADEKAASTGHSTGNPPDPAPLNDNNLNPPPETPTNSNELASPVLKPEHVVEAWNASAERLGLPTVKKLTPERRKKLATRIRQNTIEEFTEAIAAVERSPFLRGENGRGWKADFDWMLEPKNFTKLTEGTYGY